MTTIAPHLEATVLVFRTNMVCAGCIETVGRALQPFGDCLTWTVDLDDCDKILRVVTHSIAARPIIDVIRQAGFLCEELN